MHSSTSPTATSGKELAAIHDFGAKLCQPSLAGDLQDYIAWQRAMRRGDNSPHAPVLPPRAPVSINLDLTTACNYACDHCVDMDILNTGIRYDYEELLASMDLMVAHGMKSVIIIGGGEPTLHPKFEDLVMFLKDRAVQVAVVTNGSGMDKIARVAQRLDTLDWVRLSLDAGTDATFQAMHKPKKSITLEAICRGVAPVRDNNKNLRIGFSYIITWQGAVINDTTIVENIHEIVTAARLARDHGFTYISYKPFLTRAPQNNAEIVGIDDEQQHFDTIMRRLRAAVDEAKLLQTDKFQVVESTNLRVLENRSYRDYTRQPRHCHMQFFRQVLSPLGVFNCPVYRHVDKAKLGDKAGYASPAHFQSTLQNTGRLIQTFDATAECKEVTCLYNPANWFIEELINNTAPPDALPAVPEQFDYFL